MMLTASAPTHSVTRADMLATRTGSLADYSATSDTGASYVVIGVVPGSADSVYLMGRRHGNLAMATRTGDTYLKGKGPQVRVRIDFPEDSGDEAGTLVFHRDGVRVGGIAPRVLFA